MLSRVTQKTGEHSSLLFLWHSFFLPSSPREEVDRVAKLTDGPFSSPVFRLLVLCSLPLPSHLRPGRRQQCRGAQSRSPSRETEFLRWDQLWLRVTEPICEQPRGAMFEIPKPGMLPTPTLPPLSLPTLFSSFPFFKSLLIVLGPISLLLRNQGSIA